jgi:hypothetical protein
LSDPARLRRSRDDLAEVKKKLGEANASERAANRILDLLEKSMGRHEWDSYDQ